jgi:hypothetical protein
MTAVSVGEAGDPVDWQTASVAGHQETDRIQGPGGGIP